MGLLQVELVVLFLQQRVRVTHAATVVHCTVMNNEGGDVVHFLLGVLWVEEVVVCMLRSLWKGQLVILLH